MKAIIFDVDGTMADTEEAHRAAFNRAFQDAGLQWHWSIAEYRELLGVTGGKERIFHYLRTQTTTDDVALFETARALHQAKTQYYVESINQGVVGLRPGIERLIAESSQQGVRLAIATTTSPANVIALLSTQLGPTWRDYFEVIEDAATAPSKKPNPDAYLNALARLELQAHQCVAIEDSFNGLAAARRAGIPTLITHNAYTQHHQFDGAMAVFDDLVDVDLARLSALHRLAVNQKEQVNIP